jgi:hypothetical protein
MLTRMEEPRPSEAHPSQRAWRHHATLFLYVLAEKPATGDDLTYAARARIRKPVHASCS